MTKVEAKRNSSIELLRIIAMIGVIIIHYVTGGGGALNYVADNSLNKYYLIFSKSFSICAVNLFIMISAYFLSCTQKRKLSKVSELIFQVIVFRALFYGINIKLGATFSFSDMISSILPANYFVILYAVLYIISPYINILIQSISKEQLKKLVITLFIVFSIYNSFIDFFGSPTGLSTVGIGGSQAGYTIVNFVLVYTIGAYIRISELEISRKQSLSGIIICVFIIFLQALFENAFLGGDPTAWNYNHPAVVIMPVFVILLFNSFSFESKAINELAKATFTCFLFHGFFMSRIMVEKFVNGNIFILIMHQLGSAIALYLASYFVYKLYAFITKPLFKWISPKIDRLGKYIY
ncbi:MAG: acyltransferase family protein [Clostridia bacterium]|nr:acyltransferase family protein [Clostridia bacterium]